jgi:hypothetical protein
LSVPSGHCWLSFVLGACCKDFDPLISSAQRNLTFVYRAVLRTRVADPKESTNRTQMKKGILTCFLSFLSYDSPCFMTASPHNSAFTPAQTIFSIIAPRDATITTFLSQDPSAVRTGSDAVPLGSIPAKTFEILATFGR